MVRPDGPEWLDRERVRLNLSLIGASAEDLAEWGYDVTEVPSLEGKIDDCVALTGSTQFACWAEVDQFMMERVASWVPVMTRTTSSITSDLVTNYEVDAALTMPSLDRIKVSRQ